MKLNHKSKTAIMPLSSLIQSPTRVVSHPSVDIAFAALSIGPLLTHRRTFDTAKLLPAGASIVMGNVDIKLARTKDQNSDSRQQRAQRIATLLEGQLKSILPQQSISGDGASSTNKFAVYARITVASEGSRKGRLWCAELGFGFAKLVIQWVLVDTSNDNTVLMGENRCYKNSGALGFADMFSPTVGDNALDHGVELFVQDLRKYLKEEVQNKSKTVSR